MTTFTIHTVESAPAEVKEILETVEKRQQWLYSQPNRSLGQCPDCFRSLPNCLIYPPSQQPDTR